jgi:hypothetical protein
LGGGSCLGGLQDEVSGSTVLGLRCSLGFDSLVAEGKWSGEMRPSPELGQ